MFVSSFAAPTCLFIDRRFFASAIGDMSSIASSMHPEPGEWPEAWVMLEGIPEPGTRGVASPSKAGGLGTRRGRQSRARANARRRDQGRMPARAAALLHRRATVFFYLGFVVSLEAHADRGLLSEGLGSGSSPGI